VTLRREQSVCLFLTGWLTLPKINMVIGAVCQPRNGLSRKSELRDLFRGQPFLKISNRGIKGEVMRRG